MCNFTEISEGIYYIAVIIGGAVTIYFHFKKDEREEKSVQKLSKEEVIILNGGNAHGHFPKHDKE